MKRLKTFEQFLNESKSAIVTEANQQEQIKKEVISKLSDFFRCAPGNLSKFNFDGKDNIKELTKALRSTSDEGTAQYYRIAIIMAKRDLGIHESEEVNEGKKFKGREVLPNWIDPNRHFGAVVNKIKDLKPGAEYILWEPGMDVWQAEWIYQGQSGGKHIFNDSNKESDPMVFTEAELDEYITSGDVIKQN